MNPPPKHVVIVGGGIAGLAAAYYLQRKSREAGIPLTYTLVEQSEQLGGKIVTEQVEGFTIEGGPDSFFTQKPGGLQLCRDLGIEKELIPSNDHAQKIYLVRKGGLVPFPKGFRLAIPTQVWPFVTSPLFSIPAKLRMALDLVIPPRKDPSDESLAAFLRRRFGQESVDAIGGPVMAGIFVADPERLSIQSTFPMFADMERKYGSLIRGVRQARKHRPAVPAAPSMFMSLRNGMGQLVTHIEKALEGEVLTGRTVERLSPNDQGYAVTLSGEDVPRQADAVLLAVDAPAVCKLIKSFAPDLDEALQVFRYVSTATLSLAYRKQDLPAPHILDGFGFLAPEKEKRNLLACTWSSTKFDHRAPEGHVLLRLFLGGQRHEALAEKPEAELLQIAKQELEELMGLKAEPVLHRLFRWRAGNPQYDVGHKEVVHRIQALASKQPGLHLSGSAFNGIGIPDCVSDAQSAVDRILAGLA